jgi:hypothetical protein
MIEFKLMTMTKKSKNNFSCQWQTKHNFLMTRNKRWGIKSKIAMNDWTRWPSVKPHHTVWQRMIHDIWREQAISTHYTQEVCNQYESSLHTKHLLHKPEYSTCIVDSKQLITESRPWITFSKSIITSTARYLMDQHWTY